MIDLTEIREDAKSAESLLKASIETCERHREDLHGSAAATVTRLIKGLRIALDRVAGILDQVDPKSGPRS